MSSVNMAAWAQVKLFADLSDPLRPMAPVWLASTQPYPLLCSSPNHNLTNCSHLFVMACSTRAPRQTVCDVSFRTLSPVAGRFWCLNFHSQLNQSCQIL